jgi:hypothetical protein
MMTKRLSAAESGDENGIVNTVKNVETIEETAHLLIRLSMTILQMTV